MRLSSWVILIIVILIIAAIVFGIYSFNVSSLPSPSGFEIAVAARMRNWSIHRSSQSGVPPAPPNNAANVSAGSDLFGMDCASCHGQDGRTPAPIGKSMYPRVPDLGSSDVQKLSDRELFWVIKNGIRLSGMPGFGRIDSDHEIWQLTYFVRSLGAKRKPASSD